MKLAPKAIKKVIPPITIQDLIMMPYLAPTPCIVSVDR